MDKKKLKHVLNEFDLYIGAFLLFALTILLTFQVLLRYVFGHSFSWIEEISIIFFIWMTYFGVSSAALRGKHLKVDFFIEKLHGKYKKWALFYTDIVTIAFCGYIIFPLLKIIERLANSGAKTIILSIPKNLVYYVIVFCLTLTIIRLIQRNIGIFKSDDNFYDSDDNSSIFDNIEEVKN